MPARSALAGGNTPAIGVIAVILTLFFLREARTLLIPIALAVLISYALAPLVSWLEQRRIPRTLGAALVLLAVLAAIAGGGYALRNDARELARSMPEALQKGRDAVGAQIGSAGGAAQQAGGQGETGKPGGQMAGTIAERVAGGIFALAGHLVVIFFLIYFLLIAGEHVKKRILEIAGRDTERRRTAATIIDDINVQIQRYLLVLLVTAIIVGVATWIVLAAMGVRNAAMWGIFAGVFNSIPYFGPVIVSGGLFVVGMVQGGGVTQALQMSGAAIAITSLEGWLITPPLMGKVERMSPLVVFLGLLLWTWVWGGWGTILAVPMLAVIKSVADHIDALKPVGRLMAP